MNSTAFDRSLNQHRETIDAAFKTRKPYLSYAAAMVLIVSMLISGGNKKRGSIIISSLENTSCRSSRPLPSAVHTPSSGPLASLSA